MWAVHCWASWYLFAHHGHSSVPAPGPKVQSEQDDECNGNTEDNAFFGRMPSTMIRKMTPNNEGSSPLTGDLGDRSSRLNAEQEFISIYFYHPHQWMRTEALEKCHWIIRQIRMTPWWQPVYRNDGINDSNVQDDLDTIVKHKHNCINNSDKSMSDQDNLIKKSNLTEKSFFLASYGVSKVKFGL